VGNIFPDYWQEFVNDVSAHDQCDLIQAYHSIVHGADELLSAKAVNAWASWSGRVVTYLFAQDEMDFQVDIEQARSEVSIETHYIKHKYFIEEDQILVNADKIPDIPIKLIHGRKDLTCTLEASWLLHRSLPKSEIIIVEDGGHLASQPMMTNELIKATDAMASLLS